ncbi:MAG: TonB-dependent receptor [Bacteroidia bacterium]|nr:TonB-dependent receptor [Bacteroidia bacterium]
MVKSILYKCLIFVMALGMAQILKGQQTTIQVNVTGASSQDALIGATVLIPELKVGGQADANGQLSLKFDPKGLSKFTLEVSYSGFTTFKKELEVGSLLPKYDIRLEEVDFTSEDVVITATKGFKQAQEDVTVSIEVLKPKQIDLQALPSVDKALTQIPGVDNQDGQINIRGSSGYAYGVGSRVMVTLDGLPLISADAGGAALDLVPVDNIVQIEVLKGASSVLYGSSALGGVISIITDDPDDDPKTVLRVRGGAFDQPRNKALDWDGNDFAKSGSIHLFHARKMGKFSLTIQANAIKETGYRLGTDTEQYRGLAMLKWKPREGLTIGLNASLAVDSSGQILFWRSYDPDTTEVNGELVVSGGALTPTTNDGGLRKQLSVQVALDPYVKYVDKKGNMFWYRGRLLRISNSNNTGQSTSNYISYNDFLYQKTLFDKVNWVSGVTYTVSRIDGDSLFGGDHSSNSFGVYTQLDGKFGRLNTSLGARYESVQIDDMARASLPIFRAGLNYKLWPGGNVRASFGQAFRVPSIAERFTSTGAGGLIIEPNPDIRNETGYSIEAAFRQGFKTKSGKFNAKGFLDIAAFQMNFDDMVEFGVSTPDINNLTFSSLNISDARIRGLELTTLMAMEFGETFLTLNGGVTYIVPENLSPAPEELQVDLKTGNGELFLYANGQKVDNPSRLKYRQTWTIRASASVGRGPISFTTNYRYKSYTETVDQILYFFILGFREFDAMNERGNNVFDMILAYDINRSNQISLTLDNVFNEEYLVIPGFLAPQRKLTLQYKTTF